MIPENAHFIGAMAAALGAWVCAMLVLRWESFQSNGERKITLPIKNDSLTADKDLFDQLKYHGDNLYKDLDFFFKLSLAIFGGIAYIAVSATSKSNPILVREFILGIPGHRDRPFRKSPKIGHVRPESSVTMNRNHRSR